MFLWISLLTNVNPASVQAFHGDVEPLTLLTKPVGHWDGTVLKYHRSSRLRVPTHLEDRRRHSGEAMGCYCHLVVSNQHNRERNLVTSYKINHLFFFFAKTETWGSFLHHQTRDALWSFTSSSAHHNIDICISSSADEGLRGHQGTRRSHWTTRGSNHEHKQVCVYLWTVQDVMVALPLRRSQKWSSVTAAAYN